jgi:parallel beta helix pectate lyase-like protein
MAAYASLLFAFLAATWPADRKHVARFLGPLLLALLVACGEKTAPDPHGRGPQPSIDCPAGSLYVAPGENIQAAVNSNLSVCLGAGVHQVPLPILPRTGTILTGEFGAVLDASGMRFRPSPPAEWQGIIQAHNANVDDVTVRNLVIRDSAQRGIHGYPDYSDGWVIDHDEIAFNKTGVSVGNFATISSNLIHDNRGNVNSSVPAERGGGFGSYQAHDQLFIDNEIYENGPEQKVVATQRVTFRRNHVHHNVGDGIWFDWENTEGLVEENLVEENGRFGIDWECNPHGGAIRENTVGGNPVGDIFISCSSDAQVYGNTVYSTSRGIWLFVDASRGKDLADNVIHDNSVIVVSGDAVYLSCLETTACGSYATSKGNRFDANIYTVPDPVSGRYWYWDQGERTWAGWRAFGHDRAGSIQGTEHAERSRSP